MELILKHEKKVINRKIIYSDTTEVHYTIEYLVKNGKILEKQNITNRYKSIMNFDFFFLQ